MKPSQFFDVLFHSLCMISTFSMLIFLSIRFYNDESTSTIEFQDYHTREKDIYPTVSFCLTLEDPHGNDFSEGNFALYNFTDISTKMAQKEDYFANYPNFLLGKTSMYINGGGNFLQLRYDEVTIDIRKYVENVIIESPKRTILYEWEKTSDTRENDADPMPLYISYRHGLTKCVSLNLTNEHMPGIKGNEIDNIRIDFNRQMLGELDRGLFMGVFMHYPKQLMRGVNLALEKVSRELSTARKIFDIHSMEVIRRRNTRTGPCNEAYKQDDDLILQQLIKKTGCHPAHFPLKDQKLLMCSTMDDMTRALTPSLHPMDSKFLKNFNPPCDQVLTISYVYQDIEFRSGGSSPTEGKNDHDRTREKTREVNKEETNVEKNHNFHSRREGLTDRYADRFDEQEKSNVFATHGKDNGSQRSRKEMRNLVSINGNDNERRQKPDTEQTQLDVNVTPEYGKENSIEKNVGKIGDEQINHGSKETLDRGSHAFRNDKERNQGSKPGPSRNGRRNSQVQTTNHGRNSQTKGSRQKEIRTQRTKILFKTKETGSQI